jgi:peptidyl-tRNA hydrolase
MSKILQYVVIRRDILPSKKSSSGFSMGACIAQACHAATAAVVQNYDSGFTKSYLSSLGDMTVCVLGVDTAAELEELSLELGAHGINCHLWLEKPENIVTALATAPTEKDQVFPFVRHLKLLR